MKKFMLAILVAFTFVGGAFAEVKHPFDIYSGSFGPDVLGFRLGEFFDPEAIFIRFMNQKRAHNDDVSVVKLVYDFYTKDYENQIKLITDNFRYIKRSGVALLNGVEADFSRSKSSLFLKNVIEESIDLSDKRIFDWMKKEGFIYCFRSISLKEKEGGRTVIAVSTCDSRVDMIRINSNKEEVSKIGYENIIKQTLERFNLEGFERKTDKYGNEYFEDSRVGYKVIFIKSDDGEVNTFLELAAIQ